MKHLIIILLLSSFSGCSTSNILNREKSASRQIVRDKDIMTIKHGMRSNKILQMLGDPRKINQGVCGQEDARWTCVTWEYGDVLEQYARFSFSEKDGVYILNDFSIDTKKPMKMNAKTKRHILKIKHGTKAGKVFKVFGVPSKIGQGVCGQENARWICITWEYGDILEQYARFTFGEKDGVYILNDFSIDTKKPTSPNTFNTKKIMGLKQGIKSEKIFKMFGMPRKINQGVCGQENARWTCTTWEYGDVLEQYARFTFSEKDGAYLLNDFSIDTKSLCKVNTDQP